MSKVQGSLFIPKGVTPPPSVLEGIDDFLGEFDPFETKNSAQLVLFIDGKSQAYYLICHLDGNILASKCDLEAVLDPEESEEYKLNRNIYKDTYAYSVMESDAIKRRSFEDIVVEYDTDYRETKPLKVFGGQHRIVAIQEALKKKVSVPHGVRVYFDLSIEQKVDIAMANNTSIAISNDLLDRMQEELLGPELRNWYQSVKLLGKRENFADRRTTAGVPTARIARTLLVNFYLGAKAKKTDLNKPIICTTGVKMDKHYIKLRNRIDWGNKDLKVMGENFARLHNIQKETVRNRNKDYHREFVTKAIHPCVTAAWGFAAGLFQRDNEKLTAHYSIPDKVNPPDDPLNAKAMSTAKHKAIDPDNYRGLGTRITSQEIGRMLEVFLIQADKNCGITKKLPNAAIKSYHLKVDTIEAKNAIDNV